MINYFDEAIDFLTNLLAFESVKSTPTEFAPFGEEIDNALNFALETALQLGFKVTNYDGYVGEICWGENDPFAVLCHLDVVPSGNILDWKHHPFCLTIDGEYMYGRGVVDDKAPLAAVLFAMKKLKDEGFSPKRGIKFILGCDEESGWGCIDHYKKVSTLPRDGFSPDASFPVLYAEKGIFQAEFFFDFDKSKLFEISGGVATNVVSGYCQMKAELDDKLILKLNLKNTNGLIESFGLCAHASEPQNGRCAIVPIIEYLIEKNAVNRAIGELVISDALNLRSISDETGSLTMTPTMIKIKNEKLCLTVDFRYPCLTDFDRVIKNLKEKFEFNILANKPPLYNDKNSFLIQTLLSVYNKHFKTDALPKAIGGGTYARALELGAGFGPEIDCSTAHQPNERMSLKIFRMLIDVYHDAIKELSCDRR